MYPTMMPPKIGISFSSPFAFIDMITAVSNEMKAKTQLVSAMSTALPASEIPISMMTGPITTGGNSLSIILLPCHLTSALITK